MISKSKQIWSVGATVKVGFVAGLLVVAAVPTPGDFAPDAYVLSRGTQFYSFVPHKGLSKIDLVEAREMVATAKIEADRAAAAAIKAAQDSAAHVAAINELLFA